MTRFHPSRIAVALIALSACGAACGGAGGGGKGGEGAAGVAGVGGKSASGRVDPNAPPRDLPGTVAPIGPAVKRGAAFGDFFERFNRHYTEPTYKPEKVVYVSPNPRGNGATPGAPTSVKSGMAAATPGTRVVFQRGTYSGCFEYEGGGGTYDAPIVLYGERNPDGSRGVRMSCCGTGRMSCFNFEAAEYVAVDGFELRGGKYGVRAVGGDDAASQHSWGIALVNSLLDGQTHDGVLTGTADWTVFENNVVSNSGDADGHGIYLSNGSDWAIVRRNDLFGNQGATFQVNADPLSTCKAPVANADCDAVAGTPGDGGRGASDYFLIEGNYFHHGLAQGSNFTSMRYSTVRNNVFASWARHGVSFWSETADPGDASLYNPRLGSHHNSVHHNLFVGTNERHMLQFIANSDHCDVRNNLFVGMTVNGTKVTKRADAVWMETDGTVANNVYDGNVYIAGKFDGRSGPTAKETVRQDLDPSWFTRLPVGLPSTVDDFRPKPGAPFLERASKLPSVTLDRDGRARSDRTDVGPFELPRTKSP